MQALLVRARDADRDGRSGRMLELKARGIPGRVGGPTPPPTPGPCRGREAREDHARSSSAEKVVLEALEHELGAAAIERETLADGSEAEMRASVETPNRARSGVDSETR